MPDEYGVPLDSPRHATYDERNQRAKELLGGMLRDWIVCTMYDGTVFQGNLVYFDSMVAGLTDGDGNGTRIGNPGSTYTVWLSIEFIETAVINSDMAPISAMRYDSHKKRWTTWQDRYWVNTPGPAVRTSKRVHRNRRIRRRA